MRFVSPAVHTGGSSADDRDAALSCVTAASWTINWNRRLVCWDDLSARDFAAVLSTSQIREATMGQHCWKMYTRYIFTTSYWFYWPNLNK
jgi:hypothetical protein